jgi:hypothetical protein
VRPPHACFDKNVSLSETPLPPQQPIEWKTRTLTMIFFPLESQELLESFYVGLDHTSLKSPQVIENFV